MKLWKCLILAALPAVFAPPAAAQLRACNKAGYAIEVAVTHAQAKDHWVTNGWYKLQPGECTNLIGAPLRNRFYYHFAQGNGKVWQGEPDAPTGCVRSAAFELADAYCDNGEDPTARKVPLRKIDLADRTAHEIVYSDSQDPYREIQAGVVHTKCLARWDDSHQVHSVRTIVRWNYQAVKTKMKKLEHCVRLTVTGPVNVEGIAKSYVDSCVQHGLNHQRTRHALELIAAIAGDIASAGSTGGSLTAAKIAHYVESAASETIDCLTDAQRITDFVGKQLQEKFDATVKRESHWVYWDL